MRKGRANIQLCIHLVDEEEEASFEQALQASDLHDISLVGFVLIAACTEYSSTLFDIPVTMHSIKQRETGAEMWQDKIPS